MNGSVKFDVDRKCPVRSFDLLLELVGCISGRVPRAEGPDRPAEAAA
jgi:hypothetical protein